MGSDVIREARDIMEELHECHIQMTRHLHEMQRTRPTASSQSHHRALFQLRATKQLYDRIRCRLDICTVHAEDVNRAHEKLYLEWKLRILRRGLIKEMSTLCEEDIDPQGIICIHEVSIRDSRRYNHLGTAVKRSLDGQPDACDTGGYNYEEDPAKQYAACGAQALQEAYEGIGTREIQPMKEREVQWTSITVDDQMIWAKKMPGQVVFGTCHVDDWRRRWSWSL